MKELIFNTWFQWRVLLLAILSIAMLSCSHDSEELPPLTYSSIPIRWNIKAVNGMQNTRALIEDNSDLQTACTGTDAESIAIWGNFTYQGTNYSVFSNTPLSYWEKEGGNPLSYWNYTGDDQYWMSKESQIPYKFRACYPRKALGSNASATNANSVKITYDTEALQEDLLVAYKEINTATWNLTQAVPLDMMHALATLKFVFQIDGGSSTDVLKSFSLDNTLKTQAKLIYDHAENAIDNDDWENRIGSSNYAWANSGISFSASSQAVVYTTPTGTVTNTGNKYCNNGGHLFIIPQECTTAPTFSFVSEKMTKEGISLGTTEFLPGYRYTYYIKVTGGEKVTLECVAQPWDLVETTNEFSTVVSVLEEDRINWTAGSHYDNDSDPNNNEQIVLWDDINNPAEFSFKIANPLGGTWHAVLRTISGATDAFELRDTKGNIKMDGAVGKEVTLRVCAKRENTTTVSNVAELMFVVRSSGHILPVDMITVLGEGKNYKIVQNINK